MVVEFKTALKYHETFVPGQREAIVVLQNLLEAGIFSKYVLYEGKNEVRIAGGELAKVIVTQDKVLLDGAGKSAVEPVNDPLKQVEALLNSLPIEDWTAYGYTAFDLARFYSAYSKVGTQPLCHFVVPETELYFTPEGVRIKTTQSLDLVRRQLFIDTQLPNYQATTLDFDESDREKYQNSVSAMIKAIKNARALIQTGEYKNALVIVAHFGSNTVREQDTLAWSMGDGAGAFIVDRLKPNQGVLANKIVSTAATYGAYHHELELDEVGKPRIVTQTGENASSLAETAVDFVRTCCQTAAIKAGVSLAEIDFWVFNTPTPWYANVCTRALDIEPERTINLYSHYGNIGAVFPLVNLYHAANRATAHVS